MKLLTREQFKEQVFARSKGKCVFCGEVAVDPHHILDRKLFYDGGYYLDNGAAVCNHHHLLCEFTSITVEEVRSQAGISVRILPPGFDTRLRYDKWGNEILEDGTLIGGPLVNDDGCRKALARGGKLSLFLTF